MDLPLPFFIVLGVIAVTGSCINGITLYILALDKFLRKQLSSVRAFMLLETLCNLLICAFGVTMLLANAIFPGIFKQALVLCHIQNFFSFKLAAVALWYQTIIALTRVASVFVPHTYRRFVKRRFARVVLLCVPWIFSYTGLVVFIALDAYKLVVIDKSCVPIPNDLSPEAFALFMASQLENTIHTLVPLFLGLLCYAVIYGRKIYTRLVTLSGSSNNQVGPAATTATTAAAAAAAAATKSVSTVNNAPPTTNVAGKNGGIEMRAFTPTITTAVALTSNAANERDKKIRLLASVYVVNFVCIAPTFLTFGLGYMDSLSRTWPTIAGLLYISAFVAFVVNPLVYYMVSADFRQALRRIRPHT